MFQKVFYVHNESGWFDYNWKNERHNFQFYPSMATPLFTRCYHALNHAQVEAIFQKMDNMGTFKFTGGIPTSLAMNTSQQWVCLLYRLETILHFTLCIYVYL